MAANYDITLETVAKGVSGGTTQRHGRWPVTTWRADSHTEPVLSWCSDPARNLRNFPKCCLTALRQDGSLGAVRLLPSTDSTIAFSGGFASCDTAEPLKLQPSSTRSH